MVSCGKKVHLKAFIWARSAKSIVRISETVFEKVPVLGFLTGLKTKNTVQDTSAHFNSKVLKWT